MAHVDEDDLSIPLLGRYHPFAPIRLTTEGAVAELRSYPWFAAGEPRVLIARPDEPDSLSVIAIEAVEPVSDGGGKLPPLKVRFAQHLDFLFSVPRFSLPQGTIFGVPDDIGLRDSLLCLAATPREQAVLYDVMAEGVLTPPLRGRMRFISLLTWEWGGGGPSWVAGLSALDAGGTKLLMRVSLEEQEPPPFVAALAPKYNTAVVAAFLHSLLRDNGVSYGLEGVFGSLPTQTTNYRPDLLPARAIQQAYLAWMGGDHPSLAPDERSQIVEDLRDHMAESYVVSRRRRTRRR